MSNVDGEIRPLEPTAGAVHAWLATVLEQEFEIQASQVRADAHLVDDLDLDSLDGVVLIVRLEDETGLEVEVEELRGCRTVADLVELVRARLAERCG